MASPIGSMKPRRLRQPCLFKKQAGVGQGLGLDVKTMHDPAGADQTSQENRIVTVAGGGVHNHITGSKRLGEELFGKREGGSGQNAHVNRNNA